MKLFEDIFGWLPLATVINQKILVTHGGISNITDLSVIDMIDRHKVSALASILVHPCNAERRLEYLQYENINFPFSFHIFFIAAKGKHCS